MELVDNAIVSEKKAMEVWDALALNDEDYELLKMAEECTELSEVCLKMVTKRGGVKMPTKAMLIEELGDVLLRAMRIGDRFDPDGTLTTKRISEKVLHLHERIERYKGRL